MSIWDRNYIEKPRGELIDINCESQINVELSTLNRCYPFQVDLSFIIDERLTAYSRCKFDLKSMANRWFCAMRCAIWYHISYEIFVKFENFFRSQYLKITNYVIKRDSKSHKIEFLQSWTKDCRQIHEVK